METLGVVMIAGKTYAEGTDLPAPCDPEVRITIKNCMGIDDSRKRTYRFVSSRYEKKLVKHFIEYHAQSKKRCVGKREEKGTGR